MEAGATASKTTTSQMLTGSRTTHWAGGERLDLLQREPAKQAVQKLPVVTDQRNGQLSRRWYHQDRCVIC